jgi:hypothetical protein
MKILKYIIIFLSTVNLYSQISTPIEPKLPKKPSEIGLIIGLGANHQLGTSYVQCPDCEFENGNKFGYSLGLNYEDYLISEGSLKYGISLFYNSLSLKASYKEREAFEYEPNRYIGINFRNVSALNSQSIAINAYLKYLFGEVFFIKLSPSINYILSANIKHEKEILEDAVLLPNGETVSVNFPDTKSNKKTIEDGEYPKLNKLQFGLSSLLGFDILTSQDIVIAPQFYLYTPFNEFSKYGDNFKISYWRVFLELRIKI